MFNDILDFDEINVIAELANAHEGDREAAEKMIEEVSGFADAAKIQMFSADDLAVKTHDDFDLYEELSLSANDANALVERAHEHGLRLIADILGDDGFDRIAETAVDGFKIHSSDLRNYDLIEIVGAEDKPTLFSAGGATPLEIHEALSSFEGVSNASVGLIYGFQNYPTKLEDSHLNRLRNLLHEFGDDYFVGYASHVNGGTEEAARLPVWAIATGADFVEIHLTLNRSSERIDFYSSLEPETFELMVENIEKVQKALGNDTLEMTDREIEYRNNHKKCIVTTQNLHPGDTICRDDVLLKRPYEDSGKFFYDLDDVLGKKVKKSIQANAAIRPTDLQYTVASTLACRAESTRLYGKPLQLVGEDPILKHQISQLQNVHRIDEIILAISDTPSKSSFIEFANAHDLPYIVGDEVDVLGRILDACDTIDADIAVRTTTENPFIYQDIITKQIERTIVDNADLTVGRDLPLGSFTEVVSVSALEKAHEYGEDRHRSELVTSFITEKPESFDIIGIEPPSPLRRPDVRLTVDNPCDLILVRKIWEYVSDHEKPYDLEKILELYDENNLGSINKHKPDGTTDDVVSQSRHVYGNENDTMTIIEHNSEF